MSAAGGHPRRVALYGGSFDPPHVCHVLAATWAACRLAVDEVRLLPVHHHAFDKDVTPFDVRRRMAEVATAHLAPLVRVDPIEATLGGVSYTVRTVETLREREPGVRWTLLVGTDAWRSRHAWHRWERLADLVTPVVIGREGCPDPDDVEVPIRLPDVSSTEIRERVREGRPVDHLVPAPALRILREEGLYR
ncbi:MAG: nicotinate (nicotinamide) nucleotide adenylyltransferase [Myxococcota bacterium]